MNRSKETSRGRFNRPTIALFIPTLELGGAERQLLQLANNIDKSRYRVVIIVLHPIGQLFDHLDSRCDVEVISVGNGAPIQVLRNLCRFLERNDVRILHSFLLATNTYALAVKRILPRLKIVLGIRDALRGATHGQGSRYQRAKIRILSSFNYLFSSTADLWVANSEPAARAKRLLVTARIIVIRNGIDTTAFAPASRARENLRSLLGIPSNSRVVGTVANCSVYKDYPTLIAAARVVIQRDPLNYFVSIGRNDTVCGVRAKTLVRAQGLSERFFFLGSRTDVNLLVPGFDLFCSSSRTESFSNSVAEALSCGVPCVVTDVGESAVLVQDAERVVPAGNPQRLAASIIKTLNLLESDGTRMRSEARLRVLNDFALERMVANYERVYDCLLRGESAGLVADFERGSFKRSLRESVSHNIGGYAPRVPEADK